MIHPSRAHALMIAVVAASAALLRAADQGAHPDVRGKQHGAARCAEAADNVTPSAAARSR